MVSARGAFRHLQRPGLRGVVRQLLLVDFAASASRLLGTLLLGYRSLGSLTEREGRLEVTRSERLLGRPFRERVLVLEPDAILGMGVTTFAPGGVRPVGVATLALGTAIGSGLLTVALRTPGRPLSLLGLGLFAIALGVAIDFWLDGRPTKGLVQVVVKTVDGGFTLSGASETDARGLLSALGFSAAPLPLTPPSDEAHSPADGAGHGEGPPSDEAHGAK